MPQLHADNPSVDARSTDMMDGLRDLVSATTTVDCVARIEAQAARLFGELGPLLSVTEPEEYHVSVLPPPGAAGQL
jgi:hypothetical protein